MRICKRVMARLRQKSKDKPIPKIDKAALDAAMTTVPRLLIAP